MMDEWSRHTFAGWALLARRSLQWVLLLGPLLFAVSSLAFGQDVAGQIAPMKLNTTGRVLMMPVPLMDDTKQLGELVARIDPDDKIWVRKETLIRLLGERLKPEVIASIRKLPAKGEQIALTSLASTGAGLQFDQGEVALKFVPRADLRTAQKINLRGMQSGVVSSQQVKPSIFAGYVNVIGGVEHNWATPGQEGRSGLNVSFQSAVRAGSIVVENEAGYEGVVDERICPRDAFCNYQHKSGLKRRSTRIVHDRPEQALRLQAGDTVTRPAGFQRNIEIFGAAIERSPRTLQPDTAGRPTGSHSFLVEKPSQAEISVNGTVVRRLRLQPGTYDLNGFALVTGSNNVEVTLIDNTGARRSINQSTYFDRRLLTTGDDEWSIAAGLPSYHRDGERKYVQDDYAATAHYRWAFNDRLTAEINAQADSNVQMAGGGFLAATSWGFFSTRTAISLTDIGPGYAVGADWDLLNFQAFRGLFANDVELRQSLRLSAEYRSSDFRQPGSYLNSASGLIYPTHDYWLKLAASFTTPITGGISATLAGRYQFGRDVVSTDPGAQRGDLFGADVTFSGALTGNVNGSVAFGYSNEGYNFDDPGAKREADYRVMARAFVRLGRNTNISASHDTLNQQSVVTGYYASGQGVGRWETTVDSYHDGRTDQGSMGGTVAYYGNRVEARVAHNSSLTGIDLTSFGADPGQQRTSVRLGSSIAFADGKIAIGAPIRGGFAIVHPHSSLKDKTIKIGTSDQVLAVADGWGPAVVPNLPAYSQTTLPVDVDDLPLGYSLGSGAFDLSAPFRGGYALMVGSGNSVSAYGTLVDSRGEPLALLSGVAFPAADRTKEVTVITNAGGRFAAEGLSPGKWQIEMAGDAGKIIYSILVPEGSDGLFRAGTVRPDGANISNPEPAASEPQSVFRTVVTASETNGGNDEPAGQHARTLLRGTR
jgi:outer membrane usher protein